MGEFVERVKKKRLGERFNMFLSTSQDQYLEKRAQEDGVTKSEYLRELIDQDKIKQ